MLDIIWLAINYSLIKKKNIALKFGYFAKSLYGTLLLRRFLYSYSLKMAATIHPLKLYVHVYTCINFKLAKSNCTIKIVGHFT